MMPERKNYKLYKAKKQWITACATILLGLGATAMTNVSANANPNSEPNGREETEEVVTTQTQHSSEPQSSSPASSNDGTTPTQDSNIPSQAQTSTISQNSVSGKENSFSEQAQVPTTNATPVSQTSSNEKKQPGIETTNLKTDANRQNAANLAESKVAVELPENSISPADNPLMDLVMPGTQLTDADASRFFSNGEALVKAGATFSWVGGAPAVTEEDASNSIPISGTIKVTLKDGSSKDYDVYFTAEPQVTAQPNRFYYVAEQNEKVTGEDVNPYLYHTDGTSGILGSTLIMQKQNISAKLAAPLDTSEIGIHWGTAIVTDTGAAMDINGHPTPYQRIGKDTYTVKFPYVVKTLHLRTDIPTDADGNPVINAQLNMHSNQSLPGGAPNTPQVAFDATQLPPSAVAEFFNKDEWEEAQKLGISAEYGDWTAPTLPASASDENGEKLFDKIKSNHFSITFTYNKVNTDNGSATSEKFSSSQTVDVNYVQPPEIDKIFIYNNNGDPNSVPAYAFSAQQNKGFFNSLINNGDEKNNLYAILPDGTRVSATKLTANQVKIADGAGSGRFDIILTAEFGGKNKAGQPIIWATNSSGISTPSWNNIQTKGIVLLPTKKNDNQPPVDLTDGPKDYSGNDGRGLSEFVHNPNTGLGNPILNKNKEWPEGTKFEWIGKDGVHELKLDKAGESKTGDIKITLPTGSSYTVKDITVTSKANVKAENKTIDYGTVLTAADLVANKNVFPKGTTYQFAGNEPNWKKAGSYSEVKITATYNAQSTDSQGKITTHQVTTPVATCAVAINDIRQITVLEGSKTPDVNSVLNFPDTWEAHTAEYSTDINTNETNQGVITVHYPASNLDQTIKVYVTVIPKTTAVDGLNFKTDGSQIGGNNKLIDSDGAFLTTAGNNDIAYQGYDITTQPGVASNVTPASKDYKPSYSLIGLKKNGDALVSGSQTVTVRVSLPKGTLGSVDKDGNPLVDEKGNPYYEVTAKVNIAQPVHFEFVDDDNNDTVVGKVQTQEFLKGDKTNIAPVLSLPENYQLAKNQSIPTTYTLKNYSTTDPVVQIHVVHATEKITNTDTRKATVQYIYANGDKAGQEAHDDAVLEIAYKQTNIKDLVTGKAKNGNWLWDQSKNDDGFTNGYKVVSGDWTLPQNWAPVSVKNPEVAGYKAFDKGDWEANKDGQVSSVPANEFTFPTYTGDKTSIDGKNQVAYTNDSPVYEGTATHTVYYAQIQQEPQTVTEHFKKYVPSTGGYEDADVVTLPDGTKQSYAQIKVWYQKAPITFATNGSTDPKKWTVTYGGLTWDRSAGNKATPGYTVISGQDLWNGITSDGTWGIDIPNLSGYTPVRLNSATQYNANVFGSPLQGDFENDTNPTWFWRNNLTVFYVPTSELQKTITRTIEIHDPSGQVVKVPQTVTFNRDVRVYTGTNKDGDYGDDKIVFGALTGNDAYTFKMGDDIWNHNVGETNAQETFPEFTKSWQSDSNIVKPGYTAIVDGKAITSIPSLTVTPDDKDSTVDVTYIKNAGTITIAHDPFNNDYTAGPQAIPAGITHAVASNDSRIPLPTGSDQVQLTTNDFSFANEDGTIIDAPTNVGTYHIVLNDRGLAKFTKLDPNFTWNYDPKTSYVVYNVDPAAATATLSGKNSRDYNGSGISLDNINADGKISVSLNFPGKNQSNDKYTLTAGDYYFTNVAGDTVTDTVNAGTYTIHLTTDGVTNIENAIKAATNNGDPNLVNVKFADNAVTGTATYTINKIGATATLGGNQEEKYKGSAYTDTEIAPSDYTITLSNGKKYQLQAGDLKFVPGEDPTNVGTYHVELTDQGQKNIAAVDATNYNYNFDNVGQGTFTIAKANGSVKFSGQFTTDYTGSAASGFAPSYTAVLTAPGVASDAFHLKDDDLEFSTDGRNWTDDVPINAGTYQVKLSAQGWADLKQINGNNVNWQATSFTVDPEKGATYVVNKVAPKITLNGTGEKTYNGSAISSYGVTVDFGTTPGNNSVTLTVGTDYEWQKGTNTYKTAPVDAGNYTIALTDAGKTKLDAVNSQNLDWAKAQITNDASYKINKADATVSFINGTQSVQYDKDGGQFDIDDFKPQIATNNSQTLTIPSGVTLTKGDYEFSSDNGANWSAAEPTALGTYQVRLTDTGFDKLKSATNNYNWINGTSGSYTISKAEGVKVTLNDVNGGQSVVYKGSAYTDANIAPGDYSITLANGDQYALQAGDLEFVPGKTPTDVDTYEVRLSDDGRTHISAVDSEHYTYNFDNAGTGTFTITQATPTATINGSGQKTYDGSPIANYGVTVNFGTTPGNNSVTLDAGTDYVWKKDDQTFTSAPVDAGNYTVALTDAGKAKLEAVNSQNLDWAKGTIDVRATYDITKADASATLSGSNHKTFDGSSVTTAEVLNDNGDIKVVLSYPGAENTTYTLTDKDYTWSTADGKAPTNAGTYTITLTQDGVTDIQNAIIAATNNGEAGVVNVQFAKNAINGSATYTIDKATAKATLEGNGSHEYTGNQFTSQDLPLSGYSVTLSNGQQYDLKNGDIQFAPGQNPVDVATYNVELTAQAKNVIGRLQ